MNRAYSVLDIKSIDEEKRELRGIASTPAPDRMGDIVEPEGVKFALPLPLLWQHSSHHPIGHVTEAKVSKDGIEIAANVVKGVDPEIDRAWNYIKGKLVRGLSIGFRSLESEPLDPKNPWGSTRFKSWEWIELSAVTIPANAEANIHTVKQFDTAPALAGERGGDPSGTSGKPVVKPERTKPMNAQLPIAERISAFEASRAAKAARIVAIVAEADGATLNESQKEEYDTLSAELGEIDEHLVRLAEVERLNKSAAKPVGETLPATVKPKLTPLVQVKGLDLPKGTGFTRYAMALARCKGNLDSAAKQAKEWTDTPEVETVLKAAVAAGTTTDATWAKPLVEYQAMASEFIELVRAATIVGRLTGLHQVPFNIKVPRQTNGASAGWVGEGAPKPLSKLAFDTVQMGFHKAAVIVVITEELARFSNPSAEALVRNDLTRAIATFIDREFLDPTKAAVANTSPASITNGVTPAAPSGATLDDAYNDTLALVTSFATANHAMSGMAWVMSPSMAATLGGARNMMGAPTFPGLTAEGGSLHGFPVITSTNITAGATGQRIFLIEAGEILFADDGIMLDISREASLQMNDAPDNPATATTVLVSLWQNNLVGIRAERFVTWLPRRLPVVAWIDNAAYAA